MLGRHDNENPSASALDPFDQARERLQAGAARRAPVGDSPPAEPQGPQAAAPAGAAAGDHGARCACIGCCAGRALEAADRCVELAATLIERFDALGPSSPPPPPAPHDSDPDAQLLAAAAAHRR